MTAFHKAWDFLKATRQTELGEWDEDFPSTQGSVTGYRTISNEQLPKTIHEGLPLVRIKHPPEEENLRHPINQGLFTWMFNTPEGRIKAKEQALAWAREKSNNRNTPSSVVAIRGQQDLSYPDVYGNDWYGTSPEGNHAAYILPNAIPPNQITRLQQPTWGARGE